MELVDLLDKELILFKDKCGLKSELLTAMVDRLCQVRRITDREKLLTSVLEREKAASTGFGRGVAIPHGITETGNKAVIVFARVKQGIDFDALDGKPVYLIFLLVTPKDNTRIYLYILARLSRLLRKEDFRRKLLECQTPAQVIQAFREEK